MKNKIILAVSLTIVAVIAVTKFTSASTEKTERENSSTEAIMGNRSQEEKLRTDMRKLWEDHVVWTRNVIFCILDDLPGTNQAVTRLLKNQEDIGDAIKPYYGADAGKKLTDLLRVHITTAADLLKATKVDSEMGFDIANRKWKENADEISEFLSKANPNWKLADMKMMMHDHLKLTIDEAVARKTKNYEADVKAYEMVHEEILQMSDMLSDGIIKQYPAMFKAPHSMGVNK